jgi:hypothetical protein
MGVGIASMHYIGMRAIHASVHMNHASSFFVASFVVAIAASALAIWLAFGTTRRPPLLICAIVLGLAISGMHYTAMAGLSLHPNTAASGLSSPSIAISTELLAIVVAVVVFVVSGLFMLTLVPDSAHSRVPNLDLGRDSGAPKVQGVGSGLAPDTCVNYRDQIRQPSSNSSSCCWSDTWREDQPSG